MKDKEQNRNALKEFIQDIFGIQIDKFWWTMRDLSIRPQIVFRNYIIENNNIYTSPIVYYITITTFVYIVFSITGINDILQNDNFHKIIISFFNGFNDSVKPDEQYLIEFNEIYNKIFNNKFFDDLLALPGWIFCQFLFFKTTINSVKKTLFFILYFFSQFAIISFVFSIIFYFLIGSEFLDSHLFNYITIIVILIEYIFLEVKFYNLSPNKIIGKSLVILILATLLNLISLVIFVLLFSICFLIYYGFIN